MLTASKELVVLSYELKGIDQDLNEDKIFDNYTHICMGTSRVLGGERLDNHPPDPPRENARVS